MNVKLDNPQVLRYMSENLSQLTGITDAFMIFLDIYILDI